MLGISWRMAAVSTAPRPGREEAVRKLFGELQRGRVDCSQLAEEFNWFLSPEETCMGD